VRAEAAPSSAASGELDRLDSQSHSCTSAPVITSSTSPTSRATEPNTSERDPAIVRRLDGDAPECLQSYGRFAGRRHRPGWRRIIAHCSDRHRPVTEGCLAVGGAKQGFATLAGRLLGESRTAMSAPHGRLGAEKRLGEPRIPTSWDPEPALPPAQCSRIDTKEPGQRGLREAPFPPVGD
jgi:hypothetical protein